MYHFMTVLLLHK